MYKVLKDHAEIAEYKTLAAAKKLAEKEHGEVFCDGQKVYPADQDGSADLSTANTTYEGQAETQPTIEAQSDEAPEADAQDSTCAMQPEETDNTGAIAQEAPDRTGVEGRYRITSLMNVRLRPALNADIVGIVQPGTIVTVTDIQDDWLTVKNGAENVYILYGGGRYATKLQQ